MGSASSFKGGRRTGFLSVCSPSNEVIDVDGGRPSVAWILLSAEELSEWSCIV